MDLCPEKRTQFCSLFMLNKKKLEMQLVISAKERKSTLDMFLEGEDKEKKKKGENSAKADKQPCKPQSTSVTRDEKNSAKPSKEDYSPQLCQTIKYTQFLFNHPSLSDLEILYVHVFVSISQVKTN